MRVPDASRPNVAIGAKSLVLRIFAIICDASIEAVVSVRILGNLRSRSGARNRAVLGFEQHPSFTLRL